MDGSHFAARKLVRVRFRDGDTVHIATVRTTAFGTFTLPAPEDFTVNSCSGPIQVTAVGVATATGTAQIKFPPRMCPPESSQSTPSRSQPSPA